MWKYKHCSDKRKSKSSSEKIQRSFVSIDYCKTFTHIKDWFSEVHITVGVVLGKSFIEKKIQILRIRWYE